MTEFFCLIDNTDTNICFRNSGQPVRDVPGEERDDHLVPDQHGAVRSIDRLVAVLPAARKLPRYPSHSVER